jgi:cytochrome c oxidase cbb3-type subunit 3/ubiquinol-cytochrome c reductase cytochrome c subunit
MRASLLSLSVCLAVLALGAGCHPSGQPTDADLELKPAEVRDFAALYSLNCAGCHGADGAGNAALGVANPVYLAIANDDTVRRAIASGVRGSLMPAFAKSAGGTLTDEQIEILVREMRKRWAKPNELLGASPPPTPERNRATQHGGRALTRPFAPDVTGRRAKARPREVRLLTIRFWRW